MKNKYIYYELVIPADMAKKWKGYAPREHEVEITDLLGEAIKLHMIALSYQNQGKVIVVGDETVEVEGMEEGDDNRIIRLARLGAKSTLLYLTDEEIIDLHNSEAGIVRKKSSLLNLLRKYFKGK